MPDRIRGSIATVACTVVAGPGAGHRGVRDAGRARSYAAIAEFAADAPIWRVLTAVDPAALDAAVGTLGGRSARRAAPGRHRF